MSEQKDVKVTGNETPEKEQNPSTGNKEEKEGFFKKVGNGVKKNWKKALIPVSLVAGMAAGIAADRFGIPFGKKSDGEEETTEE